MPGSGGHLFIRLKAGLLSGKEGNVMDMRAIGIDIGTTTISAVVIDRKTGSIVDTKTIQNSSCIGVSEVWENLQDPSVIMNDVGNIVHELIIRHSPISSIGVTGQMHGIVYVDSEGNAVSPLYTWQDGRGNLECKDGESYAEYMSKTTGYKLATGFGSVTHFYNTVNNLVPDSAEYFCTIEDYAAMKLAGIQKPLLHSSSAAGLGCFNIDSNDFDHQLIIKSGIDDTFYPHVSTDIKILGMFESKIPVAMAIGDHQASFLGSVNNNEECLLVNIGTGSQVSYFTDNYIKGTQIDTRPYPGGGFLLAGSPLCGGRAYALLEKFFRSVVELATGNESMRLYDLMDKLAWNFSNNENKLHVSTKFCGTRDNPSLRGTVSNIGIDNFTPQHFVIGVMEGIVDELYDLYEMMTYHILKKPKRLIGSGNGIRLNMPLQKIIQEKFNMPMSIPLYNEEAAYGAALLSLVSTGYFKSISEAQDVIKYKQLKTLIPYNVDNCRN